MPKKSRKSKSHSASPAKKREGRKSAKKRPLGAKSLRTEIDILSSAAMDNIYYIAHNAVDCLELRGFGWPKAQRQKGKKGKKKKK